MRGFLRVDQSLVCLEFDSKFGIFAKSLWSLLRKFPFCGDRRVETGSIFDWATDLAVAATEKSCSEEVDHKMNVRFRG